MSTSSRHLVEFKTADGTADVYVEVPDADLDGSGHELAMRFGRRTVAEARQSLEDAIAQIRPLAESVVERLAGLPQAPDEISLEFGLKLSASASAVVASTDAEAHLKVAMTWRR